MNKLNIITVILILVFLASCGNSSDNSNSNQDTDQDTETNIQNSEPEILNTIEYSEFKVFNKDKEYFKMVDGGKTEIILNERESAEIVAEFELIKTYDGDAKQYFIAMVAKDERGQTVKLSSTTNGEVRTDDMNGSRFLNFLTSDIGEKMVFVFTGSVSQSGSFNTDIPKTEEAIKKIKSFEIVTTKH